MERGMLWRRWLVLVTAGELAGFVVPALVGILARDASPGVQLAALPAAGLVEGAMLGFAQAAVLRRTGFAIRSRAWIVATSLAAAVAWFLGMLPSTTYDTWSSWPVAGVAAAAALLGTTLLAGIGTAQALVMPRGTRGRVAWVGWTALGWCAGLTAFTVVAPPLWQPDQPTWLLVAIGVAGGLAMALSMAAVTGVGAVRLVDRAPLGTGHTGFASGQHLVSTWLGTEVHDASGRRIGRVRDLVADLDGTLDVIPVTQVLIGTPRGGRLVAPFASLSSRPEGGALSLSGDPEPASDAVPGETGLLLRRDVLDSPVVLADPPRRTRVSDVVVEIGPEGAHVVGVDLSQSGMRRRFVRRPATAGVPSAVPLSEVHLVSAHGHAAQLAAPDSTVLALPPHGMAEVLTRVPVTHARDIIHAADQGVREEAVRLLHPHVRARVTGSAAPPRRTRRLGGWRLHRPGPHHPTGDGE